MCLHADFPGSHRKGGIKILPLGFYTSDSSGVSKLRVSFAACCFSAKVRKCTWIGISKAFFGAVIVGSWILQDPRSSSLQGVLKSPLICWGSFCMEGCKSCPRHQEFSQEKLGKQAGDCMLLLPHLGCNKCQWELHP